MARRCIGAARQIVEDRTDEASSLSECVGFTGCSNPYAYRVGMTAAVKPDCEVRPSLVGHTVEKIGKRVRVGGDEASNEPGRHRTVASEIPDVD
jgi:hypothetical protein